MFTSSFALSENMNLRILFRRFKRFQTRLKIVLLPIKEKNSLLESRLEAEKIKLVLEGVVWRGKRGDGWRSGV